MANYFSYLPNLQYGSLLKDTSTSTDTVQVKNLFRRAKLREDYSAVATVFEKYTIEGNDRPDQVAEKFYGSSEFDWVVLLSNNIVDIRTEWPLAEYDLNILLNEKYTPQELVSIHHYETIEWRDYKNNLIVPAGKVVDENFTVTYTKGGALETVSPIKSVSVFENELRLNDQKRNIELIREDLLPTVIKDMKEIMRYSPNSNYISKTLKKTEPIKITGH
jgi:hypothetical protein